MGLDFHSPINFKWSPSREVYHWQRSNQSSSDGFFTPEVFLKAFIAATRGADSFTINITRRVPDSALYPGYHPDWSLLADMQYDGKD